MTTPARHRRAAPRGGTHARRRHDRGRRKAHARDARRWHVRDGGGPATVVRAWPCCAPSTAPPMWSRSASPPAGIALWRCGARPAASAMCRARRAARPHRRFLSPNDYRIPRPARKLLAHLDAGPWSPAT